MSVDNLLLYSKFKISEKEVIDNINKEYGQLLYLKMKKIIRLMLNKNLFGNDEDVYNNNDCKMIVIWRSMIQIMLITIF